MCLHPITINNPTKRISRAGGQKLKLTVPCGTCAECTTRKRSEWSFRTWHHAQDIIIRKGGYMLFDTLTYASEHLPMLSHHVDIKNYNLTDFSVFSVEHYKLFLKRLRKALLKRFGSLSDITYFLTSEYGTDDRYTHRPHYHIMLFCCNPNIHPIDLSKLIDECWIYGRTDGYNYKHSLKDFAYHCYGYDLGFGSQSSAWILRAVTDYVAKYITKSSEFQSRLDMRIKTLQDCGMSCEELKCIVSKINMFHRQSQGYGIGFLNELSKDDKLQEYLKTNQSILPDMVKVEKVVQIPMYYLRKLFYETVTSTTGKKCWQLTEKGLAHRQQAELTQLNHKVQTIKDLLNNATPQQRTYFHELLNGRDILDYCIYQQYYYGRLRGFWSKYYRLGLFSRFNALLENEEVDNTEWHETIANSNFSNTLYHRDVFKVDDNDYIDITDEYGSVIDIYAPVHSYRVKSMSKSDFIYNYTFNDKCDIRFKNFDLITSLITHIRNTRNKNKQFTFDYIEDYTNRLKTLNIV